MGNILFFFFSLLLFSIPTYAAQPDSFESQTTQELLLYYDWDEMMVQTPARRPTKIRDVAENVSIVTAEDIRTMNAHSVNEILRIVTGVDMVFFEYFGGSGSNHIHTSDYEHVLILLDGVRINDADQGFTDTTGIPVQIIDRIEVVKGPASSAWGTALGGIINIITKDGGSNSRPTGTVYGSYGEGNSRDLRLDIAGKTQKVSYYLYGGYIETDGLKRDAVIPDHFYESRSFYGKINIEPSKDFSLTLSTGYWSPYVNTYDLPDTNERVVYGFDNYYLSAKLAATLSPNLNLDLNVYYFDNEISQRWTALETGVLVSKGDLLFQYNYDNSVYGGDTRFTWNKDRHAMAFGVEYYGGENDPSVNSGIPDQADGALPEEDLGKYDIKNLGIFINDTINFNRFTIIPGLRYDRVEISDVYSEDRINPSLGITLDISEKTLIRATVAKGFARPGISIITGWPGYYGFPGNPDYSSETVRSYQAGIESDRFHKIHIKTDLFYHRIDDSWFYNEVAGYWDNGGVSKRKGVELNVTADPVDKFTFSLGYTYVRIEPYAADTADYHALNASLRYSDQRLGTLTLFGSYIRDEEFLSYSFYNADYSDMIWEIHYNKDIFSVNSAKANLFVSVRNLFNGEQYFWDWFRNPRRWFEAGIRFNF